MSGHSKWANIRLRKGAQDAKRGKLFTKAAKEVMLAAKSGGGDPASNARLRTAITAAKAVNLPKDKIETAIKKGTGELTAEVLDEITYEGYGPGGVALVIEAVTDNKNRTVAEVRHILAKHGGQLGETGSVGWIFDKKGIFSFPKSAVTEDKLMEVGLEAGVEDVVDDDDYWEVRTTPADFEAAQAAFEAAGLTFESAKIDMIAKTTVPLDDEAGRKIVKMVDLLEDNDDVQNVYGNFELPESLLEEMGA
jgi:YebC/PmpR family DNA-binding regulatory protein